MSHYGKALRVLSALCLLLSLSQAQKALTLRPEEVVALKQFRKLVENNIEEDYMRSDAYLIRWVRTKNLNVEKASQAFKDSLLWRKENRIKDIVNEDTSKFFKQAPYYVDGIAKDGRPVLELHFGRWDIRKFSLAGQGTQLVRYWDQMTEKAAQRVHQEAKARGMPDLTAFVHLADLQGYTLRQHACFSCIPIVFDFVRHYEAYYPEYTGEFLIVNTPKIFENLLNLLKPIMSPALRKSMSSYGFDKKEFSTAILKMIEPDQVSPNFGGTRKRLMGTG